MAKLSKLVLGAASWQNREM